MSTKKKLLALTAVAAGLASSALSAPPVLGAGAPEYPDLEVLPPRHLELTRLDVSGSDSGASGVHTVLRFSNTVWNSGDGSLEIHGDISWPARTGPATQRILDSAGTVVGTQPAGDFAWHAGNHNHFHYEGWGRYQLWTKAAYDAWLAGGSQGPAEQTGVKTTSCVLDEEFIAALPPTRPWQTYGFSGCAPDPGEDLLEGMAAGWGDTYDYWRDDQWIDLDQQSLPNGEYVLRSVADPANQIREKSDSNNADIQRFSVLNGKVVDEDAPTGTVTLDDVAASTNDAVVRLKVLGRDDVSEITHFKVSNDGVHWSSEIPYLDARGEAPTGSVQAQTDWDLTNAAAGGTATGGTKTVYVKLKDSTGKWTADADAETDTIRYDGPTAVTRYSGAVRADNPVGHWRLNEKTGTEARDDFGSRHGQYMNTPTLGVAGLLGSETDTAVDFSGDYVRVTDSAPLDLTNQIALEAWIEPDTLPGPGSWASVVSKPGAYALQFNGNRLQFRVQTTGVDGRLNADAGAIQAGHVHHVVATYDGAMQRLYIDGEQVASQALSGNAVVNTQPLTIGSWNGGEYFDGTIDEAAVYGAPLSLARVRAHMDAGNPDPEPPLVPSGLTATAASPTQIDLTWNDLATTESSYQLQFDDDPAFASPEPLISIGQDQEAYSHRDLDPKRTYHYRLRATNPHGTSDWSTPTSATTPAAPPAVGTGAADAPTVSSARVAGTVDPRGSSTTYRFRYGKTATYDQATGSQSAGSGRGPTSQSATLSSLEPAQTYHYAIEATNEAGTATGADRTFTTAASAPLATTSPATGIGETGATLNGTVNPQGSTTSYRFEHRASGATTWTQGPTVDPGAGRTNVTATQTLTGLQQASPYEFRIVATNPGGTTTTTPRAFTTASPGAPTGLTANAVSASRIDLSWTDNAATETGFVVERATNDQFADAVALPAVTGTSRSDTGLEPNETYWYRVKAQFASGSTAWSNPTSLTTQAAPPTVATGAASGVTPTAATVAGATDPRGAETTWWFEYGKSDFASRTPETSAGRGRSTAAVNAPLAGLDPGTAYQYRLVARNAAGTVFGATGTFTTTAAPRTEQQDPPPQQQPAPQQPAPPQPPAPGPLPQPEPPRDSRAPRAALGIARQSLKTTLRRGLKLRLKSSEPGSARTELLAAPSALGRRSRQSELVVGRRATRITRAGKVTVVVKLSSTARRLLARRRSVKLWVETTVTDGAGNRSAPVRVAVTLRAGR